MAFERARTSGQSRAYEFVCDIARGGMASVALVVRREGGFARAYAEKRLLPGFGDDPEVRAMFMDEARIAGLLRHPNVVSVLDVGEDERGAYLLMDYVEGLPLTALIRRFAQVGEPTPIQICLDIVIQAARGLHAAHTLVDHDGSALELVHRDVSPHNLLVGFDGVVRVTDFGIARALGRRTKTTTGILKGKVGYMAPEMLRFEPIDRRADLFSLGVVLHELVAGKRLYRSRDQSESARRILHEAPPDLGLARIGVPDELVRLSFELLAKDPVHRPDTAKDVARRLEAIRLNLVAVEGEQELDVYMRENLDESEIRDRRASNPGSRPTRGGFVEQRLRAATERIPARGAPSLVTERARPRARVDRRRRGVGRRVRERGARRPSSGRRRRATAHAASDARARRPRTYAARRSARGENRLRPFPGGRPDRGGRPRGGRATCRDQAASRPRSAHAHLEDGQQRSARARHRRILTPAHELTDDGDLETRRSRSRSRASG